jgi:hypothetical protein
MMEDQDSKASLPTHTVGTRQGEQIKDKDGKEEGRHDSDTTHADRPAGGSTARDSTSINPDEVESDSNMPNMPPA